MNTRPKSAAPMSADAVSNTADRGVESETADLDRVLDKIRRRRNEFESLSHVPDDVIADLKRIGVYRAFVPKKFGGDEVTPMQFMKLIEDISAADASTGWVASFGVTATYLAALPESTFSRIYGQSPDLVFAGALFPLQLATRVDGGFRVSGRWKYGSGCMGASLIGVGIRCADETSTLPRMAVLPREQVQIHPNWDVMGLQATGSHDLVVNDEFVADEWTFLRGEPSKFSNPIYRYPSTAIAGQVLAIVGLGAARASISEFSALARGDVSITGAPAFADRAYVQAELAKAEAALRSARAWFYEETANAWEALHHAERLPVRQVALLRLAATKAARVGADVTRTMFSLAGMTGVFRGHPLLRIMNDAAVVAQHAFLGEGTWHCAGDL